MAGTLNKAIIIGNVGADPESRRMQDGRPVVNLRMATSETWRDKEGKRQERTTWHRVVIFNEGLCKIVEQYVRKGAKLYVEGAMQHRTYKDKEGVEKHLSEIVLNGFSSQLVLLDSKASYEGAADASDTDQEARPAPAGAGRKQVETKPYDDDIPFALGLVVAGLSALLSSGLLT